MLSCLEIQYVFDLYIRKILIACQKGTGKTEIMNLYSRIINSKNIPDVVGRFHTFIQTLFEDIKQRFPEVPQYLETTDGFNIILPSKNTIVQALKAILEIAVSRAQLYVPFVSNTR